MPNWKHDFNYVPFYEDFMDDKSDPDPLLGDLKSQTSDVDSTSTSYQVDETFRVKLSEYPEVPGKA